ncbi:glycosyltransferase family 2 protein [Limobrevibacterium gyesilva]|uniref:Glycosyltransferase n=1 Tax=Limobrevibacterium gyesilva TaxID=2991712 RepID=A0AA41YL82_9PROT|nr:glycosyltransferase [Limobrevibacterium gyesilva]MCW3475479.1 glycosyltransferase [Limobrevibacterium gyesilva]
MAEVLRFSLVVASLGRVDGVRALFDSLLIQTGISFEVILVDQNPDGRLLSVVAAFAGRLPIRHVRVEARNSSCARNVGIGLCTGDIVGFPDDDCIYPDGVLAVVDREFAADPALMLLTGAAESPEGRLGSGRWWPMRAPIDRRNAFTTVICFNLFLRRALLDRLGGFDEALGVGAAYGACEENDLVLRAIGSGAKAVYDPALRVVHPDKRLTPAATLRAFRYGAGFGYVLRKHGFGVGVLGGYLLRPVGGMVVSLAKLRLRHCAYYWHTLRGRWFGYRSFRRP